MEKSISNRFYFDYNATSPLSLKVIDFLRSGDFLFGNPASIHTTGKNSKKFITKTRSFLFNTFNLKESEFDLVFHSGATEGINSYFKGNALIDFKNSKKSVFYFSTVDHQAVLSTVEDLIALGHEVHFFDVDRNGEFDLLLLINNIKKAEANAKNVYVNFTLINNETGVHWPLDMALKIKNETKAFVHVDAVQLIGKIADWNKLNNQIDAYVFSAHKFGALKGIGFSFYKKNSPYYPLITGGNQQNSLRSGTENALGVHSIELALSDVIQNFNSELQYSCKLEIENFIAEFLGDRGEVVAIKNKSRNLNTIFFIVYGEKAEVLSMKFDMSGIDVSTGSACSSGIIKENRVLQKMGYSFEDAKSCIRLSFSPYLTKDETIIYIDKIRSVLTHFKK